MIQMALENQLKFHTLEMNLSAKNGFQIILKNIQMMNLMRINLLHLDIRKETSS